jgi:hypothetical protein
MRSCRVFEMLETFLKVSRTHVCVSAHHAIGLMPKNLLNPLNGHHLGTINERSSLPLTTFD